VIDLWLAAELADIPYLHVKGYRADEQTRIDADIHPDHPDRHRDYPLARWGWRRPTAAAYLQRIYGQTWPRSCCTYCPYQFSRSGAAELVARWAAHPDGAVQSLILERAALALNPRQLLFATRSAHQVVTQHPQLHEAAATAEHRLDTMPWAVYDVRRIFHARRGDPERKGHAWRSVRRLHTGDRAQAHHALREYAATGAIAIDVDEHDIPRAWHQRTGRRYPTAERYLTTAPAVITDKQRPGFERAWQNLSAA
jgi:hypothetical protein